MQKSSSSPIPPYTSLFGWRFLLNILWNNLNLLIQRIFLSLGLIANHPPLAPNRTNRLSKLGKNQTLSSPISLNTSDFRVKILSNILLIYRNLITIVNQLQLAPNRRSRLAKMKKCKLVQTSSLTISLYTMFWMKVFAWFSLKVPVSRIYHIYIEFTLI